MTRVFRSCTLTPTFAALAGTAALCLVTRAELRGTSQTAPAPFSVVEKSISELQSALERGTVTSAALVDQYLARIEAYDQEGPRINAFITVNANARTAARTLDDERRSRGGRGPLHGIPIVVKDNYATADMPTTAGSKALAGFETRRDAFVVKKLRDAGAILLGKTNLHELAYGITSISSMGGQTRNPYDPSRNPGGSSGGTGAAVAANFGAAGLGTDTCGSVRNPSASNNLFGIRGTIGLSSRDGIVPLSMTQDIGGPLARSVTDLAIMLDATVGVDPADASTNAGAGRVPKSYVASLSGATLKGVRIGTLAAFFGNAPEDAEVATVVRAALDRMRAAGAEIIEVTIPGLDSLTAGTSTINAEFKHDLNAFLDAFPQAPVHSLSEILASGKYDPAVEGVLRRSNMVETRDTDAYRQSLEKRTTSRQAISDAMKAQRLDALAYPTLRRKPAVIGQGQGGSNCQLSATTGLPAMSVPAGFSPDGLPIGLELFGDAFNETVLLRIAYAYEQLTSPRRPPRNTP